MNAAGIITDHAPILVVWILLLAALIGFAVRGYQWKQRNAAMGRALLECENRYRTLFENMLEAVALHEMEFDQTGQPKDYFFLEVNRSFEKMTGLEGDAIRGKRATEVIRDDTISGFIKKYGDMVKSGTAISLEEFVPSMGKYFRINAFPLTLNRFATAFSDVTERRLAEEAIRLSEERFRVLFEDSPGGILVVNVETRQLLYSNPTICLMTGYGEDELKQKTLLDIHPSDQHGFISREFEALVSVRKKTTRGIPYLRKDGTTFVGDVTAAVTSIQGQRVAVEFVTDVTEMRKAEAERDKLLAEAETSRRALLSVLDDEKRGQIERARLVSAIEQAAESVVVTDPKGIIQYVNPAFTLSSGYAKEEAIGQHTRFLKSGKQGDAFYKKMWETITRDGTWAGRLINRAKDGHLYTEDVTISPVHDHIGRIVNFVAVKRDITRDIMLEQQLLQSQKMDVIGKLAGGVAHDFNNILQSILGFVDLAEMEEDVKVIRREFLPEIRRSGELAAALTRQLLAFSRQQVLEKRVVDINELIDRMGKMIRRLIGEDIALSINMTPKIASVWVDPGQVEQMLLNLIVNARDAMPDGGQMSITTCEVEYTEQELAMHPDARAGHFVKISVADTGMGMTDEIKRRVFEPFFTTKLVGKGTGLGLATVFGIIQQHEGWISLYSEIGIGTDFHVYLPTHPDKVVDEDDTSKTVAHRGRGQRILVVEDEDAVRSLMAQLLRQYGYHVVLAASAEQALQIYDQEDGRFDLICSDVVLPGRSGFDLVEELKGKTPELRVLMVSGYTDERTRWPQIKERGWRYLQKPIGLYSLLQTLHEMFNEIDIAE